MPQPPPSTVPAHRSGRGATLVAAGILLSRLAGLARAKLFANYLGLSPAAAAFQAAMRIPNFLQNLLGEGVLSASFIPIYASMRARKDDAAADRLASGIFGLLSLCVTVLVTGGVLLAPWLVAVIAPGFHDEVRALTVTLVRILFPGTGVLVISAWCLGILNSHRKFFLSYVAPVMWNLCIIVALYFYRGRADNDPNGYAAAIAWGAVAGGFAQFLVQLPSVWQLLTTFRPHLNTADPGLRQVLKGFAPAVLARGVVQISAWVDTNFASLISERALAALTQAQTISTLPVSLFGMAVSAAELPEMSAEASGEEAERNQRLRARIEVALQRIAFFVVPSATAFVFLGDLLSALLLEGNRFTANDSRYVWYLLCGASVGLLSQTMGRVFSSAFYALKDTRTPLKFAIVRISLSASLGFVSAGYLPRWLGLPPELGAAFLTATSGLCGWLEFTLLRRGMAKVIGDVSVGARRMSLLWLCALLAGAVALAVKFALVAHFGAKPLVEYGGQVLAPANVNKYFAAGTCVAAFGATYFALTFALKIPQATALVNRILRPSK